LEENRHWERPLDQRWTSHFIDPMNYEQSAMPRQSKMAFDDHFGDISSILENNVPFVLTII